MALILSLLLLCSLRAAEGQVPPPEDVRIVSHDMGLVLEWDPPQNSEKDFTYTAQIKGWESYATVCGNKSSLSCDFTDHTTLFGLHHFRVRADLDGKSSDWVTTEGVTLDEKTLISAPDVKLQSKKGIIEVDITDPVLKKENLRAFYHPVSYCIHYWIEGEAKKEELITEQSKPILLDLTPKVRYCVEVQIVLGTTRRTSQLSNETCVVNTESEDVKPWLIMVVLLVSFVVGLVSVLLIFCAGLKVYRVIRFLYPQAKLPEHFKQYLSDRPKSFLAIQPSSQPEEQCHEVSIVTCVEDPAVCQNFQEAEDSNSVNDSFEQEEALIQKEMPCEHELRTDCETPARAVTPSGYHDGETEMLLH